MARATGTKTTVNIPTRAPSAPPVKLTNLFAGTQAARQPSHEEIAKRAYEIWCTHRQHGRHEQDWQQAERELRLGRQ